MRDVFVGILVATGVFLITYKVAETNLDKPGELAGGVSAIIIPAVSDRETAIRTRSAHPASEVDRRIADQVGALHRAPGYSSRRSP
jgi:hypothetical protein